jgi:hypothetical protein
MSIYEKITSNGVILVDTSTIQTEVEASYKTLLGLGDSDEIDSSSQEGREVSAEVTARTSAARALAYMMNQFNPNLADGTRFDALYALTGGQRDSAEQSTCDCLASGVAGTTIPTGSIAQDDNGELWLAVTETEIPASGSVTMTFRSENYGAIAANIGEINKIISGVVGWETITNEVAASEGKEEQSLVSAKQQRKTELAANATGVAAATIAAVSALDGVDGLQFRENRLSTTQTIDNLTLPEHSTWICVDGGVISEIAEAYITNTWGTPFYGQTNTVTASYTDEISEQTYDVYFDRPTEVPVKIAVTARIDSSSVGTDAIKEAIIEYANGDVDGANGFQVGNPVSPFEIAWAINSYLGASGVYVAMVTVTTVAADTPSTDTLDLEIWQKATIEESNITVSTL